MRDRRETTGPWGRRSSSGFRRRRRRRQRGQMRHKVRQCQCQRRRRRRRGEEKEEGTLGTPGQGRQTRHRLMGSSQQPAANKKSRIIIDAHNAVADVGRLANIVGWTVVDPGREPGQRSQGVFCPACLPGSLSPGMGAPFINHSTTRPLDHSTALNHAQTHQSPTLTGPLLWPACAWWPVTPSRDRDSDLQTRKPSAAFRGGEAAVAAQALRSGTGLDPGPRQSKKTGDLPRPSCRRAARADRVLSWPPSQG